MLLLIYQIFFNLFQENSKIAEELQEIRMRAERPIILKLRERDLILQYNITQAEILQIVERLCENSIYAYKNQICEGFITVKGGHRIGLTGSCVIENGKIINVKHISSLNFIENFTCPIFTLYYIRFFCILLLFLVILNILINLKII